MQTYKEETAKYVKFIATICTCTCTYILRSLTSARAVRYEIILLGQHYNMYKIRHKIPTHQLLVFQALKLAFTINELYLNNILINNAFESTV